MHHTDNGAARPSPPSLTSTAVALAAMTRLCLYPSQTRRRTGPPRKWAARPCCLDEDGDAHGWSTVFSSSLLAHPLLTPLQSWTLVHSTSALSSSSSCTLTAPSSLLSSLSQPSLLLYTLFPPLSPLYPWSRPPSFLCSDSSTRRTRSRPRRSSSRTAARCFSRRGAQSPPRRGSCSFPPLTQTHPPIPSGTTALAPCTTTLDPRGTLSHPKLIAAGRLPPSTIWARRST